MFKLRWLYSLLFGILLVKVKTSVARKYIKCLGINTYCLQHSINVRMGDY